MTWSFLLTSLIVVASPGTGVLYTLAVALTQGARPSLAAAFGCTLGIVPHMLAAMLGLAAVLHTSALAFAALKYCGVVYLLHMAWQALRETGALSIDTACMGLSLSRGVRPFASSFAFHSFVRPAPRAFFRPDRIFHRRRAQRRSRTALLQRRRRLVLDGREHGGRLPAIGWLAAR